MNYLLTQIIMFQLLILNKITLKFIYFELNAIHLIDIFNSNKNFIAHSKNYFFIISILHLQNKIFYLHSISHIWFINSFMNNN